MNRDDRPKLIPQRRGVSEESGSRDPDRPYSMHSYSAQYGITVEEAKELIERYASPDRKTGHRQIRDEINGILALDPARRRTVLNAQEAKKPVREPSNKPYIGEVEGFKTTGRVMADAGMLAAGDPKPRQKYAERFTKESLTQLVDTVADGQELQQWLDECMARGDHDLSTTTFVWDDIPESVCPGLRRMLAMRYIESQLDRGNRSLIRLIEAIMEDQAE